MQPLLKIAKPILSPIIHYGLILFIAISIAACAIEKQEKSPEASTLYNDALQNLADKRYGRMIDNLNQINDRYPYSALAPRALLLSGYGYYLINDYDNAILKMDVYTRFYPASDDLSYANYIKALSLYQQIDDPEHDLAPTRRAQNALDSLVARFPNSDYSKDAKLRIGVVRTTLAAHEMQVGLYYQKDKFYLAAIRRYQNVARDYQDTVHTPEALYRLIECHLSIGVPEEANNLLRIIESNFPDNEWAGRARKLLAKKQLITSEG